jgi:ABC-type sugar transport system ATPase subunit
MAMVSQNCALYPQKSLRDNVGTGLKLLREEPAEIDRRVTDAATAAGRR